VGSTTLMDLGFLNMEDIPDGLYFKDELDVEATPPEEITLNDPDRHPGEDVEEIEAGWLTPFYKGWRREVVYRHARPTTCEIYYWSALSGLRSGLRSKGFTANTS
jgi:hypothetical protein